MFSSINKPIRTTQEEDDAFGRMPICLMAGLYYDSVIVYTFFTGIPPKVIILPHLLNNNATKFLGRVHTLIQNLYLIESNLMMETHNSFSLTIALKLSSCVKVRHSRVLIICLSVLNRLLSFKNSQCVAKLINI